jgi:hypothetical protein
MPKLKPSDHVAALRKKQADLMAQLREVEIKAKLEAKETKRLKNEIAGSIAIKELDANPSGAFAIALRDLLDAGVTKAAYRAMFDLAALPKASPAVDAGDVADGGAEATENEPAGVVAAMADAADNKSQRRTGRRG